MRSATGSPPIDIGQSLEEWITGSQFSCLGARAAVRRGVLDHGEFGALDDADVTGSLHEALCGFAETRLDDTEDFATYVAVFSGPLRVSEARFETLLWRQLSALHEVDRERYPWAAGVAVDPTSPRFSFSVAATAFFVVGMHPGASRVSRRFALPALAFNSFEQFQRLRADGTYQGMQQRIRQRELRLQGSLNPNLSEHGTASDARQYSGRRVGPGWTCPFSGAETPANPNRLTQE